MDALTKTLITTEYISGVKERFYKRSPHIHSSNPKLGRIEICQTEFLSELDPYGHKINNPDIYENIFKKKARVDSNGKEIKGKFDIVEIPVDRVAIAMQETILSKQLTHLCGEKMKFTLMDINPSEKVINDFIELKQGWDKKNMETARYEFKRSLKAVGDAAFCPILTKGKFSYRVFSLLNGDTLHPVRDFSGKIRIFGRGFTSYDYKRNQDVPYMEVWDDKYYTLLSFNMEEKGLSMGWNPETFLPEYKDFNIGDNDGWTVVGTPVLHGFQSCPIEYLKNEAGACWTPVQDLIDKLEIALSRLFENNKAYAFRIMLIKGGFEIQGDLNGEARAILMDDNESDARFMEKADASTSFALQLEQTLKYILMGSFIVLPPESTNGDTPGVTVKIMYSPAIEKGLNDKNFFNNSMDRIFELFKEGYGIEMGKSIDYAKLDVRADIPIYIHQNESEVINNQAVAKQAGFRSAQTAYENTSDSAPDEARRIEKERKQDLEYERLSLVGTGNDGKNPTNNVRQLVAEV